jgi:hypothetical protein
MELNTTIAYGKGTITKEVVYSINGGMRIVYVAHVDNARGAECKTLKQAKRCL